MLNVFILYFWIFLGALLISLKVILDGNNGLILYISFLLISVFFASFSRLVKTKGVEFLLLALSLLTLFIMYGLRDVSGIDDSAYERIFYEVLSEGWLQRFRETTMEPGYLLLNYLFGFFINDYIYFQAFVSFISLSLFYKAFYENKKFSNIDVAVFFLFCMLLMQMQSVALVRMFLAMSITAVSYKYLISNNPVRYILLILLAMSFHYSAFFVIFLVYFLIRKEAFEKRMFAHYLLAAVLLPLAMLFIVKFVVPVLGGRYQHYISSGFSLDASSLNTLPFIFIFLYFYNAKFERLNQFQTSVKYYYKLLVFLYCLSLFIFVFSSVSSLGRLVFYTYVAFILLSSILFKSIKKPSLYFIVSGVFVMYGYLYMYRTQFTNEHHLPNFIPVQNILF